MSAFGTERFAHGAEVLAFRCGKRVCAEQNHAGLACDLTVSLSDGGREVQALARELASLVTVSRACNVAIVSTMPPAMAWEVQPARRSVRLFPPSYLRYICGLAFALACRSIYFPPTTRGFAALDRFVPLIPGVSHGPKPLRAALMLHVASRVQIGVGHDSGFPYGIDTVLLARRLFNDHVCRCQSTDVQGTAVGYAMYG